MGGIKMTYEEAARILDPETSREALLPYAYDPQYQQMLLRDACQLAAEVLRENGSDRLKELVEADREGRIAVFPCKPSDVTVYQLRNKKHALGMGVHPRHVGCAKVWGNGKYELLHGGDVPCKDKDFGKTWFLKEDEAQAALEKMNERKEP